MIMKPFNLRIIKIMKNYNNPFLFQSNFDSFYI